MFGYLGVKPNGEISTFWGHLQRFTTTPKSLQSHYVLATTMSFVVITPLITLHHKQTASLINDKPDESVFSATLPPTVID